MVTSCAAYGCTNSTAKRDCIERRVSFHNFPLSDSNLLKAWLTKMKRKNFVPSKYVKVCSDHFEPKCFIQIGGNIKRCLEKDAVPTIFSFTKSSKRKRCISPESYKSPILTKVVKFEATNASVEELRHTTTALWKKNEELKANMDNFKKDGYGKEQVNSYINKLHEYNKIRDIAKNIMERIADHENTTVIKIYEDFGMTDTY